MKFADPYRLKLEQPRETIVFAASQLQGEREAQEDFFANFNDECFVVADGVGGMPHGEVAAKLAVETAIWGYKHIRQRRYYWLDKKLFLKRIFRSTNITLWQKRREKGFELGLATTMLVAMVGAQKIWVGSAGDSSAWLLRGNTLTKLTVDDVDNTGRLTKVLGVERYGLVPQDRVEDFKTGDVLLLATDGVVNYLTETALREPLINCGDTIESLTESVVRLLKAAQSAGSTDNLTAVLIKRVATS